MNDCYLNFLVSFRALFSLDVGANLVNSKQTIGIILPDLSLLGYAVPVESFGIGLFVILFTYLIIEYNVQLLSHEKFKIAMNAVYVFQFFVVCSGHVVACVCEGLPYVSAMYVGCLFSPCTGVCDMG